MSKNKNVDMYSPFLAGVKNDAVLVTIIIEGERYPSKMFKQTPWYLVFEDDYIKFVEEKGKEVEVLKKTAKYGIEKVELGVIRRPSGGGLYGYLLLDLRVELFFKYDTESIVVVCDAFSFAEGLFQWLEKNEIPVVDPLDMRGLLNKELDKPLREYLLEILTDTSNEKYKYTYKNMRDPK